MDKQLDMVQPEALRYWMLYFLGYVEEMNVEVGAPKSRPTGVWVSKERIGELFAALTPDTKHCGKCGADSDTPCPHYGSDEVLKSNEEELK